MRTVKIFKHVFWVIIVISIATVFVYLFKDRLFSMTTVRKTEEVIQQGKPTWLMPSGSSMIPDQMVQVSTRVLEQPLSQIASSGSLSESIQNLILHPDQAVVKSEMDDNVNTLIKVLTPVSPIKVDGEHECISSDLGMSTDWMFVETKIFIPYVRSRLKPVLLCSEDGNVELGAGFELWRFEQKPKWLSSALYKVLEGGSTDILLTNNRIGTGLSIETNRWLDIGGGFTLDMREKRVESIIYLGMQF